MKTSRFRPPVEPTHSNVTAEVKWYNPTKGFGFVKLDDGAPDAFLHASVLEQAGFRAVAEGAKLTCDIGQGQRGPQVLSIYNVEEPPEGAVPRRPAGGGYGDRGGFGGGGGGYGGGGGLRRRPGRFDRGFDDHELSTQTVERPGEVLSTPDKGFGFILPDDGRPQTVFSTRFDDWSATASARWRTTSVSGSDISMGPHRARWRRPRTRV